MPRYKFIIEYDGTVYAGWQRQRACRTIQGEIEQAIHCLGEANPTVIGAGRTDAGVHARGQVAHVDLKKDWEPLRITGALNHFLKNASIAILKSERIDDTFHARFSAVKREYRYEIICRRSYLALDRYRAWRVPVSLDCERMQRAAQYLIGKHDFTTFRSSICQAQSPVKTVSGITISGDGEKITIKVWAPSFLHKQVRSFVGTLKMVGTGSWAPQDVQHALQAKQRSKCGMIAPAEGLYLDAVSYEGISL